MTVAAFLAELVRLDIRVWLEADNVRCSAPAGTLTDDLHEQLRLRKAEIVSFLRMAGAVAAQQSAIVPLQPGGTRPPVFAVPGHTGDVFCFRALAQALGEDQPFFGLQPPGFDGRSEPLARIEELASHFAGQIRAFRPHGPWIIAGYCSGGTVAFELARQLLEPPCAGLLAFFGAPYPSFFRPLRLFRHRLQYRAQGWRRRVRLLAAQSNRERLDYLAWRLRRGEPAIDPIMLLQAKVRSATHSALRAYEPRPYAGCVHHFVPCQAWARSYVQAERWRSVAARVENHYGPDGCTGDDMLHAQYAPGFARQFRESCARVQA